MIKSNKLTLEQGNQEEYKKMILEQAEEKSRTPQWDNGVDTLKEAVIHNGNIFVRAFISSLLPSFIICVGFIIILALVCFK